MLQGKEREVVTLPRPTGLCSLVERHKNEDLKTISESCCYGLWVGVHLRGLSQARIRD